MPAACRWKHEIDDAVASARRDGGGHPAFRQLAQSRLLFVGENNAVQSVHRTVSFPSRLSIRFALSVRPASTCASGPTTVMPPFLRRRRLGRRADAGVLAHADVLAEDGVGDPRAALDDRAGHEDGILHLRALGDGAALREHGIAHRALDLRAAGDDAVVDLRRLAEVGGRLALRAGVDGPVLIEQVQPAALREHIHVRVPEGIERADVLPVALESIGGHLLAGIQHGRDDILAEVIARSPASFSSAMR